MAVAYDTFDIVEVAEKCGIVLKPHPHNDIEVQGICPFCGDRKYHLGLNRKLERFHCFRCKEKGNSVSLYAKIHGISNREAYQFMKNDNELSEPFPFEFLEYPKVSDKPLKSLEERHDIYYDFLNMLCLQPRHRENLMQRGLGFSEIHRFMYKSIPLDRVFRREVLEELSSKYDLNGVPGFYKDKHGDTQMYIQKCGGMFIPVCNKDGYIQGLQMRLDVKPGSSEKKFRWFSSKYFGGVGAKSWVHIVGDTTSDEAIITEGAMKSDIASVLSGGRLFIAVPGVNSLCYLTDTLRELNIKRVYEAFDMDKFSTKEVKDALIELKALLRKNGVEFVNCSWNPCYKGIDDYYLAKSQASVQLAAA